MNDIWLYILVMAAVTFIIRALPLTLIRGRIENRFLRSFLYYVPYVTLSVMTFPAIISATGSPIAGAAALIAGIFCAWRGLSLVKVAAACCAVVLALEFVIR
ncbi:MAG: AzlD domain-containing protein [Eubacteriales bacterium]|nr:AzlD domain-containing protein [Eubacteriales bacterium]MDD3883179.1 AzlD domain-containing protein [Eubacteriales bacterium]MDD4513350.1 AzlD domain-containing protein [Eubacteriales bacterium]